jgi:hypothetical protein
MDPKALAAIAGGKLLLLIDHFAAANDRWTKKQTILRLIAVLPTATCDITPLKAIREAEPRFLLPPPFDATHGSSAPPWDAEVPPEALRGCVQLEPMGLMSIRSESGESSSFVFAATSFPKKAAISALSRAAESAGKVTQTLTPSLAPVHSTSSHRNLWLTWLFGHLAGTDWIQKCDGYEKIELPFGASCELSRRLLYGVDGSGKVYAGPAKPIDLKPSPTKKPRVRPHRMDARDLWIYQQAMKNEPYQDLADRMEDVARKRGWKPVRSKQGVRQIAIAYAKRNGLEKPARRRDL